MGKNLEVVKIFEARNIKCYRTDRFNLDNELMEPYQDDTGEYNLIRPHETNYKNNNFRRYIPQKGFISMFQYFLDGSRYTYKIADMETSDGEYMPIIAAQVGAAICKRDIDTRKMQKYYLSRKNFIALYDHINEEDFLKIESEINSKELNGINFACIRYSSKSEISKERPENAAIAKILNEMHEMEINLLNTMMNNKKLGTDKMLILDGSLQFLGNDIDEKVFEYVIGISKSFNPNLKGKFRNKDIHVATALINLEYGQRTLVFKHQVPGCNRIIGTWYVRIRPRNMVRNPLDGIVKVEKIAITEDEKELGFDTDRIDTISHAILCERNVTCHGKDSRWCNHLYPIYLTEKMLKESFINEKVFLNII